MSGAHNKLFDIRLDDHNFVARNPEVEHERRIAIYDLLEDNSFEILGSDCGPYSLLLKRQEARLVFGVSGDDGAPVVDISLSLSSFGKIIRDYFTVCESYYDAIKSASPSLIEAIDLGRRSLHDEGAEMLREKLSRKVKVDDSTARRLFTLICVLHVRG